MGQINQRCQGAGVDGVQAWKGGVQKYNTVADVFYG